MVVKEQREHTIRRLRTNLVWEDTDTGSFHRSRQQVKINLMVFVCRRKRQLGHRARLVVILAQECVTDGLKKLRIKGRTCKQWAQVILAKQ